MDDYFKVLRIVDDYLKDLSIDLYKLKIYIHSRLIYTQDLYTLKIYIHSRSIYTQDLYTLKIYIHSGFIYTQGSTKGYIRGP